MAPLKDKLTISSRATVCLDNDLKGDITIGSGTIVHPKATIYAIGGPIVIGSNNIIEEAVILVNRRKEVMRIGDDNLFEVGCRVESPSIGFFNTFSARCRVSPSIRITSNCTIGPQCQLIPQVESHRGDEDELVDAKSKDETLEPYTVVFGEALQRRTWDGRGEGQERALRAKHVEYLKEIIPKYNRCRQ